MYFVAFPRCLGNLVDEASAGVHSASAVLELQLAMFFEKRVQ